MAEEDLQWEVDLLEECPVEELEEAEEDSEGLVEGLPDPPKQRVGLQLRMTRKLLGVSKHLWQHVNVYTGKGSPYSYNNNNNNIYELFSCVVWQSLTLQGIGV